MIKTMSSSLAAGALLLLLVACDEDKYTLKFSHHLHVTENEMSCDECHGELGQPFFTALSHETCNDCHDEPDSKEIKPSTCGMCHEGKLGDVLRDAKAEPKPVRKSVFMHTEALTGKCADCHGSIMDEQMKSVVRLKRSDVLAIREEAHASAQDCMACHVDMARDQAPPDHDQAWMKRHGQFGMLDSDSCSVCHTEDSCIECHSVMQPSSHNNMFRQRTHGVVAAWDRNSCMTCHEVDSCTTCHANTRPRSHNARWGAPGYKPTHCIGCHDTSTAGDGCVTCHEGGNDVMLHERYWGGASFDHSKLTGQSCYICHWTKTP
jgi:hypothetical protein